MVLAAITPNSAAWPRGDGFAVLASGGSLRDGVDQLRPLPDQQLAS